MARRKKHTTPPGLAGGPDGQVEAIRVAFAAVTTGPVEPDAVRLLAVPHDSALIDWKHLVRALFHFYRREDDLSRRFLGLIAADSAPARLVPALETLMEDGDGAALTPAARGLVAAVRGLPAALATGIQEYRQELKSPSGQELHPAAARLLATCERAAPDRLAALQWAVLGEHIQRRYVCEEAVPALRLPVDDCGDFWARAARGAELARTPEVAVLHWRRYLAVLQHDPRADERTAEQAAVCRRILVDQRRSGADSRQFLRQLDYFIVPSRVRRVFGEAFFFHMESGAWEIELTKCLSRSGGYELLAAVRPDAEVFRSWLGTLGTSPKAWRLREPIAQAWAHACPRDAEPLKYLAESTLTRGVFSKAAGFAEKADRIEGSPATRELLLAVHYRQALQRAGKERFDQAAKDLARLRADPDAQVEPWPALLLAAQASLAGMRREEEAECDRCIELADLLENPVMAEAILKAVYRATSARHPGDYHITGLLDYDGQHLVAALETVERVAQPARLQARLPREFDHELADHLETKSRTLDAGTLLRIARKCDEFKLWDSRWVTTMAGLARGEQPGWFLCLQLYVLRRWFDSRRRDAVFSLAVFEARRNGDEELLAELRRPFGFARYGIGEDTLALLDAPALSAPTGAAVKMAAWESLSGEYGQGRMPYEEVPVRCECAACRKKYSKRDAQGREYVEIVPGALTSDTMVHR